MKRLFTAGLCLAALAGCSGSSGSSTTGPSGGNPGPTPTLAYAGTFHPVAHAGMGMADVYLTGSSAELRFTGDFATQGGPNLEVWLVQADDPSDNATVLQSAHLSLGPLQSASGAQTYPIPAGVDLTQYHSVTVWCVAAQVNFTTAPLMME
jgi:Electron transfer DM13